MEPGDIQEERQQTCRPCVAEFDLPVAELFHEATQFFTGSQDNSVRPCYPFPHDVKLCMGEKEQEGYIQVACHKPPKGKSGSRRGHAAVFFLPGVHGGVGPCRADNSNYDQRALFPQLADRLAKSSGLHCYRVSWSRQCPPIEEVLQGLVALAGRVVRRRKRKVIIVGHSFGGNAALLLAETLQRSFHEQPNSWPKGASIQGVCTLASPLGCMAHVVPRLGGIPKLFCHGKDDMVVDHECAVMLHSSSAQPASLELLDDCGHDMLSHKAHLLQALETWVVTHTQRSTTSRSTA